MKIGIMQPYFLPYIGYWQLMGAVDRYVILDDVNYIKRGWINRNRILLNGKDHLFTLPLVKADAFRHINENTLDEIPSALRKTVDLAYRRAPHYAEVVPLVDELLGYGERNLAKFVGHSIRRVADYLGVRPEFCYASEIEHDPSLRAQDMILDIVKRLGGDVYYNAIGGQELYDRVRFAAEGVSLGFVKPTLRPYAQFGNEFIPGLSILDVMMFCDRRQLREQLGSFEIV